MQDVLLAFREFLTSNLSYYLQDNKDVSLKYRSKLSSIYTNITNTCLLERSGNIFMNFVVLVFTTTYLSERYLNTNSFLLVLLLTGTIGLAYVFIKKMELVYNVVYSREGILKIEYENKIHKYKQFPLLIKHYNRLKKYFNKLLFIKGFLNVYHQFYILIGILLIFISNNRLIVLHVITLKMLLDNLDNSVFEKFRNMPQSHSLQTNIIRPMLNDIKSTVPSPLSIPNKKIIKSPKIKAIDIKNLRFVPKDINQEILKIKRLNIKINKGLYLITGDSGEGKSVFMNLLANIRFQTEGTINLIDRNNKSWNYNSLGYWNYREIIKYIWISRENYSKITIKKLFSQIINEGYISDFFNDFFKKGNTIKDLLFKTNLFRKNELHILNSDVGMLSGGQQARAFTALHLVTKPQIILIDESLERTTMKFSDSEVLTRERLIKFITYIVKNSDKTVFLLIQGGKDEEELVKNELGRFYLGKLHFRNNRVEKSR